MNPFPASHRATYIRLANAAVVFITACSIFIFSPNRIEFPGTFVFPHLQELFDSLLLAAVFYAAIGLIVGKRRAWQSALVILSLSLIWEVAKALTIFNWTSILVLGSLIFVAANKRLYPLRSENDFVAPMRWALVFTAATTAISSAVFFAFSEIHHQHFHFIARLLHTLDAMYSLENLSFTHIPHGLDPVMATFLSYVGIINYIVIALALSKPLIDRTQVTRTDRFRIMQLITSYSRSSEDYFKYWPEDKNYFFSERRDGFIAYRVQGGNCIALADPIASTAFDQARLISSFRKFTDEHGWRPAFLHVPEASSQLYEAAGFELLKIGENAVVDCDRFVTETMRSKYFRNIRNRFEKKYQAEFLISHPPHAPSLMKELEAVSAEWLGRDGREERGFVMGYFDGAYLNQSRIAYLQDSSKTCIAFVSLQPNFNRERASIDLMRTSDNAPSNTLDYLFCRLIETFHQAGYKTFDLGLAPLSGLAEEKTAEGKLLHGIYGSFNRWFAFKGLRRFKDKFEPKWEPSYLAYVGARAGLPSIALSLNQLLSRDDG